MSKKQKAKAALARVKKKSVKEHVSSRRKQRAQDKISVRETRNKITGSFRLFRDSASFVRQYWKILGGIALIYLILSVVLIGVRGSGLDINQLREDLSESANGGAGQIGLSLALFGLVAGSGSSPTTESGGAYQPLVFLVISLATIWALRQLMAGQKIGLRDTFYKGMYPLVPVMLVLLVIGLQLIPLTIGTFLFSVAFTGAVAVGFLEKALWLVLIFGLVVLSLWWVTASIFGFYIATLPDMRPLAALRSARKLVRFRRWTLMRKLLFLPLALLVIGAAVTLPFIWIWPLAAQWVFLVFSMVGLVFAHTYIYSLYRELL